MILKKHIGKTVINSIFIVLLVLMGVAIFSEFTREFSDIGRGNYGWWQALQYVPMMLPQDLYSLFPMAGLLGSLIGLGILAMHSELVVMRASGMSIIEITRAVLGAAFILIIVMLLIGEVFGPFIQHKAVERKSIAMSGGQTLVTTQGIWLHNQNNFIHIDTIASNGSMTGILRYELDANGNLAKASFAKEGVYDATTRTWLIKNISETKFLADKTVSDNVPSQSWDLNVSPSFLSSAKVDTLQKSLWQLYKYIQYCHASGLDADRYEFVFWQRIFAPFALLVMIFLAVPFLFGLLRNATLGIRIVAGVVFGFLFFILNQFAGSLTVVFHLPVILTALLPTLLFAGLGYVLLRRVK